MNKNLSPSVAAHAPSESGATRSCSQVPASPPAWRTLSPVYVPVLSSAHLLAHDRLFHLGRGRLTCHTTPPPHIHDCYEIGLILSGHGIFVVGEAEYPFTAGQVYILHDLQAHMAYPHGGAVELFVVHFLPEIIQESWVTRMRCETQLPFLAEGMTTPFLPLEDVVTPLVRGCLERIACEAEQEQPAWEVVVGGLIFQSTGYLARRLLDAHHQPQQTGIGRDWRQHEALVRIRPALRLIEEQFAQPLSLDAMAATAQVSRSHLCALFSTALDTAPIAYRNRRRLVAGQHLLQTTERAISEIAHQVGFSSVQEFNRLFLRETGMRPTDYRQAVYAQIIQKISS